ncbi:MAG: S1 RNA-binding domain-containing protein [Proteobacteria bacterium]|nr:S1 RNA-binding domain-containing protein [Pseudomonadota bacterium]
MKKTILRRKSEPTSNEPEGLADEPREEPKAAPLPVEPKSKKVGLSLSDQLDELESITSMDPSEIAALMNESLTQSQMEVGDKVTGRISRVGSNDVFVDLNAKAEGIIPLEELENPQVGAKIEAFVLTMGDFGIRLSQKLTGKAAGAHLEAAMEAGIPVEGTVVSRNPGGFTVKVGGVSAFCPVSLISRFRTADLDEYINQKLEFQVIECDDKVVVSRRALLEKELEEKADVFWTTAKVDDTFTGVVRNIQPFGVFVDCNGVDGLVPKREISWGDSLSSLAVGQTLEVRILQLNHEERKLTLTAKDPELLPWNMVGTTFVEGGTYQGTVMTVASFGAFVELAPGLQGLIHVSNCPGGMPQVGQVLMVRILSVDNEKQRLALAPSSGEVADESATGVDVKGTVRQVVRNGVVVQLEDGRTGWLPVSEVELPPGGMLAQRFRRGHTVTARVVSVEPRIVLSQLPQQDMRWRSDLASQKSEGFGVFADLLKGIKLD